MKSINLTLAALAGFLAVAVAVWKTVPVSDGKLPMDPVANHRLPNPNNQRAQTSHVLSGRGNEEIPIPTKSRRTDRPVSYPTPLPHSSDKANGNTTANPSATQHVTPGLSHSVNPMILRGQLMESSRKLLLKSPIPTPAAIMALDPAISGIPASEEPALQAMAEEAKKIIADFNDSTKSLSPESSQFLAEKLKAVKGLEAIDYLFRAKYGKTAWMAHQMAIHYEQMAEK